MNFLFPAFLAALGVVVIPILLHLFHLRRFKTFYFSNLAFIKKLEVSSKSARKIKNLLVLISRILALIFLVLAFAQPFWNQNTEQEDGAQEVRIIYIDNSYSMTAIGVEGELMSQARAMAKELISKDPVGSKFLIISNFFNGEEMRLLGQADAVDYIDALPIAPFPKSADAIFSRVEDLKKQLNISGELIVLSDGQQNQWQAEAAINISYPVKFVQLKPENSVNLSVDSVWTNIPIMRPGAPFELNIAVKNNTPQQITSATLNVRMDQNKQLVNVDFNGERSKTITLNYISPANPGFYEIEVEIEDNQVHFDDVLYASFQVMKNMSVGIIHGSDAPKNVELVYGLDPYYQTQIWSQNQVNLDASGNVQLLVVNQLSSIDGGIKQRIINNVKDGKAVVLVPHPQSDVNAWNALLGELQMPLLQKSDSGSMYINNIRIENQFFTGLFDNPNPKIQIPVRRKTKLVSTGSRSLPLITFSDGSPFLAKSSNPDFNVFLFNADLHRGNANLLNSDLFSALFLRIGEVSGDIQPMFSNIGEAREMRFKMAQYKDDEPISLVNDQISFIPRQQFANGVLKVLFSGKSEELMLNAGYYSLQAKQEILGITALNFPRFESDLTYFAPDDLERTMRNAGIENFSVDQVSESYEINKVPSKLQSGLWRIFLLLALLFFLIEMSLIKFWR
jgi:hypothetical protein